jgi:UDP-glucose 6-dehydrogenase
MFKLLTIIAGWIIRNSKVIDIISHLQKQGIDVDVYDPNADEKIPHV